MDFSQINEHIKNYIKNDKTRMSIMLSAPWGTGKSFYAKNILCPYLKDNKIDSAYISLYGLDSFEDISKSIFVELKTKKLPKKSFVMTGAVVVAKTILKIGTSFHGINPSIDNKDLCKLYESINVKNKLIIFDDFERSNISVDKLLGYINNLTENDGAKVLIITDENKLLEKGKNKSSLFEHYLEYKEKTICDKLVFNNQINTTIKNILIQFFTEKNLDLDYISNYISENSILFTRSPNLNLRSVIYACQKISEIIAKIGFVDKKFNNHLLISSIVFKIKSDEDKNLKISWDGEDKISSVCLGTAEFPFFKFLYEYFNYQILDAEKINLIHKIFEYSLKKRNIDKGIKKHLETIYSYYIKKETDVLESVKFINNKISENQIDVEEYPRLINYLISIKYDLGISALVDSCKNNMLKNTQNANFKALEHIRLFNGIELSENKAAVELNTFLDKLENAIKSNTNNNKLPFDINDPKLFCELIRKNTNDYIIKKSFINNIDIEKFIDMLKKCNAEQILDIRSAFLAIYRISNLVEVFPNDFNEIDKLYNIIKQMLDDGSFKFDKIQCLQTSYFVNGLRNISYQLSPKK